jgi:heme ABC exporter ATP-binding subunit CcmA
VTTPARPILEGVELVRQFGVQRAVDRVSISLVPGRVLGVFGPNGAGKTTLLKILAGGLRATSGRLLVDGRPVEDLDRSWRRRIGVVSHQSFLYGQLTVTENLRFYGRLYGLRDLRERIPDRLERGGLEDRASEPVRALSRGLRQRVAVVRALLHDPDVVLLDEPFTGLDAHAAEVLRGQLKGLKDGSRAVVLVTHHLTQGVALSDDVVIQVGGRFVVEAERATLPDDFGTYYREVVDGAA